MEAGIDLVWLGAWRARSARAELVAACRAAGMASSVPMRATIRRLTEALLARPRRRRVGRRAEPGGRRSARGRRARRRSRHGLGAGGCATSTSATRPAAAGRGAEPFDRRRSGAAHAWCGARRWPARRLRRCGRPARLRHDGRRVRAQSARPGRAPRARRPRGTYGAQLRRLAAAHRRAASGCDARTRGGRDWRWRCGCSRRTPTTAYAGRAGRVEVLSSRSEPAVRIDASRRVATSSTPRRPACSRHDRLGHRSRPALRRGCAGARAHLRRAPVRHDEPHSSLLALLRPERLLRRAATRGSSARVRRRVVPAGEPDRVCSPPRRGLRGRPRARPGGVLRHGGARSPREPRGRRRPRSSSSTAARPPARVDRVGPDTYTIRHGSRRRGRPVDAIGPFERRITCGGGVTGSSWPRQSTFRIELARRATGRPRRRRVVRAAGRRLVAAPRGRAHVAAATRSPSSSR